MTIHQYSSFTVLGCCQRRIQACLVLGCSNVNILLMALPVLPTAYVMTGLDCNLETLASNSMICYSAVISRKVTRRNVQKDSRS
jgi:hypothetical protein